MIPGLALVGAKTLLLSPVVFANSVDGRSTYHVPHDRIWAFQWHVICFGYF